MWVWKEPRSTQAPRGKKLEEEYTELRRVEKERQKRKEREMLQVGCPPYIFRNRSTSFVQAQYGSLRKHQNRYNSIMNDVEPEFLTPTVNFEKRTNRLAYELLEPESQ